MHRLTIYSSYSVVIYLGDVSVLMPHAELGELSEMLLHNTGTIMGETLIGWLYDPTRCCIYATFKHRADAAKFALSWVTVLELSGLDPQKGLVGDE